jgi:hypothetical protein
VRGTGEVFELIDNIKEILENINFYIPIYFDVGTGAGNVKFLKKYEMPSERTGRKIMTGMKNSVYPQSFSKRRKLIRL